MTPEQINVAIEREVGNPPCWLHGTYDCACAPNVRNYCADLNAMHEAEDSIHETSVRDYHANLHRVVCGEAPPDWADEFLVLHATARQRAESFLRTVGKWKE